MKPTQIITLFLLYGLLVLCVNDAYGKHSGNGKRNRTNHDKADRHGIITQKVNYKNLSKHLLKRLDSSCRNSPPPHIHNGKFVRFKKTRIETGKSKHYMMAEFKCNEGYKFRNSRPKKMFCSKKKWVGKKPVCDKIKNNLDTPQADDPNAVQPQHFLYAEKCSPADQAKCKHLCRMRDDQPECHCLPGFEQDGNDCKDIDECQTNHGGCQLTCTNNLGSFICSCPEGFRLSSDSKTCEDINECHLRNGHGPCQDTCENSYGSYKCSCSNLNGTRLAVDMHTCSDVNECTEGTSGCSHSCVNTHGRAFCTCPNGMELGPDWKTCQDINECENPKINELCKFGCVNLVGSYYCTDSLDAPQSDQPVSDNETIQREDQDDYEDGDYEDEDYEEGDYKDDENYDEVEENEEKSTHQKENEESTTERNDKNNSNPDNQKENDKSDGEESYQSGNKEAIKTVLVTTTVVPITPLISITEKATENKNNNDEYEDENYESDYNDEYNEENMKNETNKKESNVNRSISPEETTLAGEYSLDYSSPTHIHTTTPINIIPSVASETITNTEDADFEMPKKEIQNRLDENYNDNYDQKMYTESKEKDNGISTDPSVARDRSVITTTIPKPDITEKSDDSEDEEYDEDYDEEYYDGDSSSNKTLIINEGKDNDEKEKSTESITAKLPEVDIDKVNIDIHEIIENNTQNNYNTVTETTSSTTSEPQETTKSNETDDDDYEYEDYEEEDYKELKKGESKIAEKELTKCEKGYILNDKGECSDLDECQTDSNPCSDSCQNTVGSYHCSCPTGFTISLSDSHSCQDINECLDKPCSHTCVNEAGSYHCECPSGLPLQNNTCVNLTCSHGQTKINGVVQCTCPSGFILGSDNSTCEDVNECQLDNQCSQICRNTIGSFECACEPEYELTNEKFCVDIDECKANHGCPQLCENFPGGFNCSCEEGYNYHERENACIDINECDDSLDLDECTQLCINYEGGYECDCYPGYKLGSDHATCEDINECSLNNGNCSQICINQPSTFQCSCEIGYVLSNDNRTCDISDPCLIENGGCSHQCVSENGIALCKCPEGQVLEGKDCYKIDPCVANNGGCSHICVNVNGAVRCDCPDDYELTNETSCVQINPCTINNGNCSHFCEFVDKHVNCLCPDLHVLENKTHCIEINPCLENNGRCSHICSFENHAVTCSCPSTHELHNKTHCFEKNPCLVSNGGCSDFCNFSNGTLTCSCPENYYLEGKTCYRIDLCLTNNGGCSHGCFSDDKGQIECLCPDDFELNDDRKTCSPKNPCLLNNGNCSHICNSSAGFTISSAGSTICSCPDGFKLKNKTYCEELDACLMENGGCSHTCENIKGQAKCICPENYILLDSKNCISIDPCQENNGGCSHECTNMNNIRQCSCPDHYNLENGTNCVPVNPCLVNNGGCSHECVSENDEVFCFCPDGYQLHGRKCVAVNPCDTKNGGCSHVCSSINGQVICKCPPDHELIGKTCFKINPCLVNNGGCSHGCSNVKGQARCSCPPGYKLFGKKCSDEDPCIKSNGGCSHYCHNKEGRRECSCPPGYLLRPNKRICKEVNECKVNRGGCSHGCKNLPGSYECTCPHGFILDSMNNKTCVDIDECQTNKGNCQMFCKNLKGGFRCECPEGYVIQKDKQTCKISTAMMKCRIPKPPKNGVMRCLDQNSDPDSLVPPGTKCNVWCNEGFKLEGKSQRLCNNSGIWEGEAPLCVVASCPSLPAIQNGWYLPGVCNSGKVYLGESCKVHCRKGYRRNIDFQKYMCAEDLQWTPPAVTENLNVACVRDVPNVYIKCPGNGVLDFVLPEGLRQMTVQIPRPESNVDFKRYVTSYPSWGTRLETTLPAGKSEIRFTAMAPADFNSSASCKLTINVLDKESPRMMACPENIERPLMNGENMQIVHWLEPTFYDNVGIATVYKSREPGSEFGLGLHHVSYVASDEAGNRAFCHFTVDIKDEYDSEVANSIRQHPTYTNYNSAGRYRAVLICPSGVQYMSNSPDNYNNMLTSEAGCYWRHVRVTKPMQPQSFKIPKVYSESRLPPRVRNNRRVFFKWNR